VRIDGELVEIWPNEVCDSMASSGPVNVAPSLPSRTTPQNPSALRTLPLPCQMATSTQGRVCSSVALQSRAPQPFLPPPTPSSRTVVIVSPSQSRDWFAMLVVSSICMTSPDSMSKLLIPMDVDYIMAVMG